MEIDLHAFFGDEAERKVIMALMNFKNNNYETQLRLMTGRGTGALKQVVGDVLDSEGIDYYWDSYSASYVVDK